MKILLAADGSKYTQKSLEFIVKHLKLLDAHAELLVMHVQMPLPTGFNVIMGFDKALELHASQAEKIFAPVKEFLERNAVKYRCISAIGPVVKEIVDAANKEQVDLILMGTHGRDLVGRALMGSVAQRVIAASDLPALLVK